MDNSFLKKNHYTKYFPKVTDFKNKYLCTDDFRKLVPVVDEFTSVTAGRKTVETIAGLYMKTVIDHSESYYDYKDLNDYLRGKCVSLCLPSDRKLTVT